VAVLATFWWAQWKWSFSSLLQS